MSCPYCLAFSRDAANKANPRRKTLVQAYWEYEEDGSWVSFSPAVGGLLETSYESWMRDPVLKKAPEIQSGKFLYRVDFTYMRSDHPLHQRPTLQKMRRVGVTSGDVEICTMDKKLYDEFRSERDGLKAQVQQLETQRAEMTSEHEQKMQKLEAELGRLQESCAKQLEELEKLRSELSDERAGSARIWERLGGVFPGRLVTIAGAVPGAQPREMGRVRAIAGQRVEVDLGEGRSVWAHLDSLVAASEIHFLARPGSLVLWRVDDAGRQPGVVCDAVDAVSVHVLGADGCKRVCHVSCLEPLEGQQLPDAPLQVGHLVRTDDSSTNCAPGVGMVVRTDENHFSVRFRENSCDDYEGGSVDRLLDPREVDLRRDDAANMVRPGAAVRFKINQDYSPGHVVHEQSSIGIVYAVHGDGTAVVDFLPTMGLRCNAACLEVVDQPTTAEFALLCLVSDCLAWSEVSAQQSEEREASSSLQLLNLLPSALCRLEGVSEVLGSLVLGQQTGLYRLLCQLFFQTFHNPGDVGPPFIEKVECVHCVTLERRYDLIRRRVSQAFDNRTGCSQIQGLDALEVQGGVQVNEYFLWYAAALDTATVICADGWQVATQDGADDACAEAKRGWLPLVLSESAAEAARRARVEGRLPDAQSPWCFLLVRTVLGECSEVECEDCWPDIAGTGHPCDSRRLRHKGAGAEEFVLRRSSQALPVFRITIRHKPIASATIGRLE